MKKIETMSYYQKMNKIYERLLDRESKVLFEARISYLLDHNQDNYMKTICGVYNDWKAIDFKEREKSGDIIIFGCGHDGKMANELLSAWGYKVLCFCDNYQYGTVVDGKKVLSVDEVVEKYRNITVLVASIKYGKEMYIELVRKGFFYKNIVLPKYERILATRGRQYFDAFKPCSEEVYVDAGAFDGRDIFHFNEWVKGNYRKIYAFEPIKNMYQEICQKVEKAGIENIQVLNNAVWNRKEEIYFVENAAGSHIDNKGKAIVGGVDIDSIVNQEKVTFIKMDIEGAELKALEGARNTIIINHPRLAVCIYHKALDVVDIASYLLELVPEYKFYIRQYASNMWETVLYAVI
ncbi:FkbM family methyltransferase [Lachnospiraceae bacterium 28-4]|nr:FkbM family methyltransferase [Lachnospiraceae bacterium 28-4]